MTRASQRSAASQSSKRALLVLILVVPLILGGCGVWMNPNYSEILDRTAVLSAETARRAEAGQLTPEEMISALKMQAQVWQRFRDARDGKEGAL